MKIIVTVFVAIFLFGCESYTKAKYEPATWLSKPESAELAPKTSFNVTGATVKSPDEPGWYLAPSKYYGVWFGRFYGENGATLLAYTTIHRVGGFESDTDLLNSLIKQRVEQSNKQSDATGLRVIRNDNELISYKDSACFMYDWSSEDGLINDAESGKMRYLNAIGYFCRHPENPIVVFQMEVSYRGPRDTLPQEIRILGEQFFEDVEFNSQEGLSEIR